MAEILCRDYFPMEESSLSGRNSLQGLFSNGGIIPERKECFAGIIFQWRNHLWTAEILCRDAFSVVESSLSGKNSVQGCICNGKQPPQSAKVKLRIHLCLKQHPQRHRASPGRKFSLWSGLSASPDTVLHVRCTWKWGLWDRITAPASGQS